MGHMIFSAIIHGLIYRAIWSIFGHTGMHGTVAIVIAILLAMWVGRTVMNMFRMPYHGGRRGYSARNRHQDDHHDDRRGDPP